MTTTTTDPDVLAEVEKNSSETIRVRWTTFNGRRLLDCRVWTRPPVPTAEGKPTRKGLTLRADTWRELVAAIAEALEAER